MSVKSDLSEVQVRISNLLAELLTDQTGKETTACLSKS